MHEVPRTDCSFCLENQSKAVNSGGIDDFLLEYVPHATLIHELITSLGDENPFFALNDEY